MTLHHKLQHLYEARLKEEAVQHQRGSPSMEVCQTCQM